MGRLIAIVVVLVGTFGVTEAQSPRPFGLDPYKPSDAALLRIYSGALMSQARIEDVRQLDPYKPSDAALLREIGRGVPLVPMWPCR